MIDYQVEQLRKICDLQEIIDKAIDLLEKRIEKVEEESDEWSSYVEMKDEEYIVEQKEILNILKGDDNNER
jgi:hypothetical protein